MSALTPDELREQADRLRGDTTIAPRCLECGAGFVVSDGRGRKRYCAKRCSTRRNNRVQLLRHPQGEALKARAATGYWSRWAAEQKSQALAAYGGAICACCGETEHAFLTIDHVGGGGRQHRAEIRTSLYRWLRLNNYPSGFRVLCMNCNFATRFGRPCPHESDRQSELKRSNAR